MWRIYKGIDQRHGPLSCILISCSLSQKWHSRWSWVDTRNCLCCGNELSCSRSMPRQYRFLQTQNEFKLSLICNSCNKVRILCSKFLNLYPWCFPLPVGKAHKQQSTCTYANEDAYHRLWCKEILQNIHECRSLFFLWSFHSLTSCIAKGHSCKSRNVTELAWSKALYRTQEGIPLPLWWICPQNELRFLCTQWTFALRGPALL